MIDVLVAGGGPVGLAAAIHARLRGLSVTVVEPRALVDKACGEGLMPRAVRHLESVGVNPQGWAFNGIEYIDADHNVRASFSGTAGLGVRRTTLIDALRERAVELGVDYSMGRVQHIEQSSDRVKTAAHEARYLIAADGLHSPIRKELGLSIAARGPGRFGLRRHYAVAPWNDMVEVHWGDSAEAYVTPVGPNLVGIAVLGIPGEGFERTLAGMPGLAERINEAQPSTPTRGAGPLRQASQRRTSGRVLLVGDSAGYIDALTGEGMRVGFDQAQAAIDCIANNEIQRYESEWRSIVRTPSRMTETLLWAQSRPRLRRSIVPLATQVPSAFTRSVRALAG